MAKSKYAGTQTEKNLQEAFAGESQPRKKDFLSLPLSSGR